MPPAPGEGSRLSMLVERASVAHVEKQIPNGFRKSNRALSVEILKTGTSAGLRPTCSRKEC